jgi:hypothetical protein
MAHVCGMRLICGLNISEAQGVLKTELCRYWVDIGSSTRVVQKVELLQNRVPI